ncbi:DNRLRE domain-containing protein [Metabacillus indicus]|uniref:DNRLRE domain-containing protein n=1 Tax=Metabacillus indicus TaxID=246786 RepID=UPI003CFA0856
MKIENAKLNVFVTHHYFAENPNGLWLDRVNNSWDAKTLTWNNKPTSTNISKVEVGRNQWASFDVTSTISSWASGSLLNFGFKLHTNGNGKGYWKKITSSMNASEKPYLSVTYTIPKPKIPSGKVYAYGDGTGYINLNWEQVVGATEYKVWIYNGKDYESFNVGKATSWTTKDKGIWPSEGGRFDLHQDGGGMELPTDPSQVYRDSGGTYPTNKNYWFKVSAILPQGESTLSDPYTPTIPNLSLPKAPIGNSFSYGDNTGYVELEWENVIGATGYKVWIFNGLAYEPIDVKNVTSWSSFDKRLWPTQEDILQGRYRMRLEGTGEELSVNPSLAYSNAGTKYATNQNYWFRISAYNQHGETLFSSSAFQPVITTDINHIDIIDAEALDEQIPDEITPEYLESLIEEDPESYNANSEQEDESEFQAAAAARIIMEVGRILWKGYKVYDKITEAKVEKAIENHYGDSLNRYSNLKTFKLENTSKKIVLEHGTSSWGMEHILSKHHPKYWTGLGRGTTNTFFPDTFTFSDIENVIITVANYGKNEEKIVKNYNKKVVLDGYYLKKPYRLVINDGSVTTLYPLGWNYGTTK